MISKLRKDFLNKADIPINTDNDSQQLNNYYILFKEGSLNTLLSNLDENGIPLCNTYIDVEDKTQHYYPITIGQYALAIFHTYLKDKSLEKKNDFLKIANWFFENRVEDDKLGVYWESEVPKPEYRVFKPWKSAFSQSRGLSVLLRAWQITGDDKYLEVCKKALIPFKYDISEGGVSVDQNNGMTFYEEYVAEKATRVLDGHCFALFGLYDFVRAVPKSIDEESHNLALKLFKEGVEGLKNQLPLFDMGYWMRFNRCDLDSYPLDPCTIGYLRLVKTQLTILNSISKNEVFELWKTKLNKYDNLISIFRMYIVKYKALKKLNRL